LPRAQRLCFSGAAWDAGWAHGVGGQGRAGTCHGGSGFCAWDLMGFGDWEDAMGWDWMMIFCDFFGVFEFMIVRDR